MDLAQPRVNGTQVSYGDDKGLLVEFVDDAVHQPFESNLAGRAIYKQVAFISIIYPGDKTKKTYRPATEQDKARFAAQWTFFEKGMGAEQQGTPITQWNYLSKSQALELKHMGFWTVELLANATDQTISSFMGGMGLREQAKAFLTSSAGDSKHTSLVAENEQLKAKLSAMSDRMDALEAAKEKSTLTLKQPK